MDKSLSRSVISVVIGGILFGVSAGVLAQDASENKLIASGSIPENTDLSASARADGEIALAVGTGASADKKIATSVGSWSAARGQQSVALGGGTYAYADASTALGSIAFVDNTATYGTAAGN
ncbi:TPA: hypothetical protein ACHKEM_005489, partial [Escherichia coli]